MPPKTDGPALTLISTDEQFAKVYGEAAEKDMLFFCEVFAQWCGPSEAILSTFRRLRMDLEGRKIKFMQARLRWVDSTPLDLPPIPATRPGESFACPDEGVRDTETNRGEC